MRSLDEFFDEAIPDVRETVERGLGEKSGYAVTDLGDFNFEKDWNGKVRALIYLEGTRRNVGAAISKAFSIAKSADHIQ